jgi:hypothetical protein
MSGPRIPRTIAQFDVYITTSDDHLQADDLSNPGTPNHVRLGVLPPEAAEWTDWRDDWDALYAQYGTPGTRTQVISQQVQELMLGFRTFANPLLARIAANTASGALDESKLNFKKTRAAASRRTTTIGEDIYASIKSRSGGEFQFGFRSLSDASRPSLPEDVDCIVARYKIVTAEPVSLSIEPDDTWNTKVFYKARNTFKLPAGNKGKYLLICFQWGYTPDESLSGPMSSVKAELIN